MFSLKTKIIIPKHVISTTVEQDAVLLNTQNNQYYTLDEVGARFWTLLAGGNTLQQINASLLDEYDVASDVLERDLLELIADLRENDLVQVIKTKN